MPEMEIDSSRLYEEASPEPAQRLNQRLAYEESIPARCVGAAGAQWIILTAEAQQS